MLSFENINTLNKVIQTLLTAGVKKNWCELHSNIIDASVHHREIRSFYLQLIDVPDALVVYKPRMEMLKGSKWLRLALGPGVVADPSKDTFCSGLTSFLCLRPLWRKSSTCGCHTGGVTRCLDLENHK